MIFLRNYQQEMISRIHRAWSNHRSVLVQMPTGTGKTHVLAGLLCTPFPEGGLRGMRVLIVAHRVELIAQIKETLLKLKIKGEEIKVESIQTISRRIGSLDFTPDLVFIDEAHHALAKSYRILWEKWPQARFLGLTATPCRMNRSGFTDLFDTLIRSWSVAEFIEKGVLSSFDYVSIRPDSAEQRLIDSLEKRSVDGDYQVKEMDNLLNRRPSIERLYRSLHQFARGKKGIVYAISIDHAGKIAAYYSRQGVKAVAIDSKTPREMRKQLVRDFKDGKIEVLVNVDVFSEGFDCPDVEFVQLARPTLSLSKYLQQVGRGLRKTSGKESCMLIDNVGLYHLFGLPIAHRDWDALFRGELSGKGVRVSCKEQPKIKEPSKVSYTVASEKVAKREADSGMMLVVSHKELLSRLNEWSLSAVQSSPVSILKAWQDEESGKWGLRRGRQVLTAPIYNKIYDTTAHHAAVKFSDGQCGLVDERGTMLWQEEHILSMKFVRDNFLKIKLRGESNSYIDLCNGKSYGRQPIVKSYGNFEVLMLQENCYTRTKRPYVYHAGDGYLVIRDMGFYLGLYEYAGDGRDVSRRYCILSGDEEDYYSIHSILSDGSLVVHDPDARYYRVERGRGKEFIGSSRTIEEWKACKEEIHRLATHVPHRETGIVEEIEENKPKMDVFAEPYRLGNKWGVKVAGRIVVPPIYRSVRPPVGNYCAVEKNYHQWGVITLDGRVLIEPKYPDVTLGADGTALLQYVTGRKERVRLE